MNRPNSQTTPRQNSIESFSNIEQRERYLPHHREIKNNVVIYSKDIINNWEEFTSRMNRDEDSAYDIGINCMVDENIIHRIFVGGYSGPILVDKENDEIQYWEDTSLPVQEYKEAIYQPVARNTSWGGDRFGMPEDGYPIFDDIVDEFMEYEITEGFDYRDSQVGDWFTWIPNRDIYQTAAEEYLEKYGDEEIFYRKSFKDFCLQEKKLKNYTWLFTKVSDDQWKVLGLANSKMHISQIE